MSNILKSYDFTLTPYIKDDQRQVIGTIISSSHTKRMEEYMYEGGGWGLLKNVLGCSLEMMKP